MLLPHRSHQVKESPIRQGDRFYALRLSPDDGLSEKTWSFPKSIPTSLISALIAPLVILLPLNGSTLTQLSKELRSSRGFGHEWNREHSFGSLR
jgi:hypothetical protein